MKTEFKKPVRLKSQGAGTKSHALIRILIEGVTAISLVAMLWNAPIILTVLLLIMVIIELLISKSKTDLKLFIIIGFLGTLAELAPVHFGAWSHAAPDLILVPSWLPLIWGIFGLSMIRFSAALINN